MIRLFKYTIVLLVLITALSINSFAQDKQRTIMGKVITFEESFPLKDVSISVKGGKPLATTQASGTFSIKVSPGDRLIVAKHDDYEVKEIAITKASEYNIVLKRRE